MAQISNTSPFCPNWRNDHGIEKFITYKKKFAWRPIETLENEKLWWVTYYVVYENWTASYLAKTHQANGDIAEYTSIHRSRLGYISEADYLVRKLTESL